jgi:hypothetical protein
MDRQHGPRGDRQQAAARDPREPGDEGTDRRRRQDEPERHSAPATRANGLWQRPAELHPDGHGECRREHAMDGEHPGLTVGAEAERHEAGRDKRGDQEGEQPIECGVGHTVTMRLPRDSVQRGQLLADQRAGGPSG